MQSQPQPYKQRSNALTACVGAACAAILFTIIPQFEGTVNKGYLDPVGIPTKCTGDTSNVVVGRSYSAEECEASLETQLLSHAGPVLKCNPELRDRTFQLAASVSFAYSIGAYAFCNSTTSKRFRSGDFVGACRAINQTDDGRPQWVTAKGVVLPGLVKRRAEERALCEKGLQ